MSRHENSPNNDPAELLNRFNKRESCAFGKVYSLYYREVNLYAASLYRHSDIQPEDVVHDIFVTLWSSNTKFSSLDKIKAYVYVSIKNGFTNFIHHHIHVEKYQKYLSEEHLFVTDIIECELYSFVHEACQLLPELYAKVLRMYIDGWKSGEIAEELGRTEQNIYNIKNSLINILKSKMSKDKMLFLTIFLH